jgi:hypothetical protein
VYVIKGGFANLVSVFKPRASEIKEAQLSAVYDKLSVMIVLLEILVEGVTW